MDDTILVEVRVKLRETQKVKKSPYVSFWTFSFNEQVITTDKQWVSFRCKGLSEAISKINPDEITDFEIRNVDPLKP